MPVPGLGQVDDRELQTLAAVHGQDRDRPRVGLQPPGSLGADLRASAIRARSHSTRRRPRAGPEAIAACRLWPRCRRSVSRRSPRAGQQPLGTARRRSRPPTERRPRGWPAPAPPADPLGEIGQPLLARRRRARRRSSRRSRSARPAGPACCRGCSRAISRVSQSCAIGEANTELAPCMTAGTPAATRRSRIASPRTLLRTRTAMSAGEDRCGCRPRGHS